MPDLYRAAVKQSLSDLLEQADALVDARLSEIAVKHLAGQHDQVTHGHGGGGREQTIKKVEDEMSRMSYTDNERAVIVARDGGVILDKHGGENEVEFSAQEVDKMRGATLTHNHPNGSSFSETDIDFAGVADLSEVRVVGVGNKYTYSMTRTSTNKPWPSKNDVRESYRDAEGPHYNRIMTSFFAGGISKEDARAELSHSIWADIVKDPSMNLTYMRTARP